MKFIDEAKIFVKSGDGGAGHISFRREKGVPKGGPDGGTGGKGGSVVFIADPHMSSLLDFRYKRSYIADNGGKGGKYRCTGKNGKDVEIKVPVGTMIKSLNGKVVADLVEPNQRVVLAHGGDGGRGNMEFCTPTNQTPRTAEPGWPGREFEVKLELKLLADIGLVGFPNAGKSTLIASISAAKPKIADYPFTTLVPNLGIVKVAESKSYVVADIPGLIEGASDGKGLGIQFLKHVERSKALVFLIDSMSDDIPSAYRTLRAELKKYNKDLEHKDRIICITKTDAWDEESIKQLKKIKFREPNTLVYLISAVTGDNIEELKMKMWEIVQKNNELYSKE
jgi:GTP-binding protein